MATPALEERVARLEGIAEGTRDGLRGLREDLRSTNARLDRIESRLWWMLLTLASLQLTTWVTIMLAILFKG